MTTTISNQYGEFTADTEREALALARAAKRDAKRKEKIDAANRATARDRAMIAGYRILSRFVSHDKANPAWIAYTPTDKYLASRWGREDGHQTVVLETEDGCATYKLYCFDGDAITHIIINGCGWTQAIAVEINGVTRVYSVGVCDDSCCVLELETITVDWFNTSKNA